LARFEAENMTPCQLKGCSGKFFKTGAFFKLGKWFCEEKCADKDPEIKDVADLYEKGIEFKNDNDAELSDDVEVDL